MQGVPIGTADFQKAWLATDLAEQKAAMLRLSTYVPDKRAAAQMLTHCIVPRITHILRALPRPIDPAARLLIVGALRAVGGRRG